MSLKLAIVRFLLWSLASGASLTMALANGLGYVWSGAWQQSAEIAIVASFLPLYFAFAWVFIPSRNSHSIVLLWTMSGVAYGICIFGSFFPAKFPLKIMAADFTAALALPMGAYLYRRLAQNVIRE